LLIRALHSQISYVKTTLFLSSDEVSCHAELELEQTARELVKTKIQLKQIFRIKFQYFAREKEGDDTRHPR
jgi:hypothetical protein